MELFHLAVLKNKSSLFHKLCSDRIPQNISSICKYC